jgi:energy-coupling factor transport system ATP-binding protein
LNPNLEQLFIFLLRTGMASAIATHDLRFEWKKGQSVLKGCTLDIPQGEFWMLLGTNGCGKSTLLRLIAGLLAHQTGTIEVSPKLGFVFQNPDHQLVMPTVGADVAFGLVREKLTTTQIRSRVLESLAAVNLLEFSRRPIYALSGGQKQRVAIAGAIAAHCDVLLLDEPTALLDPDSQLELVAQVQRLVKDRGITALWVTHRLNELEYADGALLMDQGIVIDRGDPARLKTRMIEMETSDTDN